MLRVAGGVIEGLRRYYMLLRDVRIYALAWHKV
jgi:hypothetical protein